MLNGGRYQYILGQDYTEFKETGKEDYTPGANSVRRVLDFYDWRGRFDFMSALLGYASPANGVDCSGGINREPPDSLPENGLYICTSASVEPVGAPAQQTGVFAGAAKFPIARVTAIYQSVTYQVPDTYELVANDHTNDTYISKSMTVSAQYLSLQAPMQFVTRALAAGSSLTGANSCAVSTTPGKLVAQAEMIITHHMVPNPFGQIPYFAQIVALLGTVNRATFEGVPAGGVLYLGCNPKVQVPNVYSNTDLPLWTLEHRFLIQNNGKAITQDSTDKCAGHNYIFDTKYNRWDLIAAPTSAFTSPLTAVTLPAATRLYQQQPVIAAATGDIGYEFYNLFGA